jgi:hypothetical protein
MFFASNPHLDLEQWSVSQACPGQQNMNLHRLKSLEAGTISIVRMKACLRTVMFVLSLPM